MIQHEDWNFMAGDVNMTYKKSNVTGAESVTGNQFWDNAVSTNKYIFVNRSYWEIEPKLQITVARNEFHLTNKPGGGNTSFPKLKYQKKKPNKPDNIRKSFAGLTIIIGFFVKFRLRNTSVAPIDKLKNTSNYGSDEYL